MKKTFLTIAAALACAAAFGQGKLAFTTDSLHLVYYDSSAGAQSGTAVSSANMPAGVTLVADLYGGTSSASLSLVSTTVFGATAGRWTAANTTFSAPALAAGQTAFFQIQIRDSAFATEAAALAGNSYGGNSPIFTAVPQASIFNPIYQATSPVFSTWANGTFALDSVSAGSKGAISVGTLAVTPEPGTMALAGLGAAAMMVFRRRKQ